MSYTITNGYCTLADVKAALRITDTIDDDRIGLAIDSASRLIETRTNRRFYKDSGTSDRLYVCESPWLCQIDDVADVSTIMVKTDPAGDGSFGVTWSSTDYQVEPINGLWEGQASWPRTKIRAVRSMYFPVWGGIAYPTPYTQALVKVTAQWGWSSIPSPINKACIIQAIAILKADDAPFGATPFAETGIIRLRTALHPTAELLVYQFAEDTVMVA